MGHPELLWIPGAGRAILGCYSFTVRGKPATPGEEPVKSSLRQAGKWRPFDARGHGDSDWAADGNYSYDAMDADLKVLAPSLTAVRPAVVGAGGPSSGLGAGRRPGFCGRRTVH